MVDYMNLLVSRITQTISVYPESMGHIVWSKGARKFSWYVQTQGGDILSSGQTSCTHQGAVDDMRQYFTFIAPKKGSAPWTK